MNITKINSYFKPKISNMETEKKESMNFQFLTPSKNAEKVEVYVNSLNEALECKDVTNIAISGSYGAGKSSFLKTFENENPQYNFLDISLATFKKEDKDLSLIEKSILQQIFYKVEQEKVPFSRFKRINKINYLKSKSFLLLITIISLLIFFDTKYINSLEFIQFLNSEKLKLFGTPLLKFLSFFILLGGGFFFIKSMIHSFTGITLDKLNLNNLEISTNKPDENSLLNKYLDEILYFFSATEYNIVVFQDLDRFENIEIFTKLRELNNFINNSEQVSKKIVFLYAIKDEMFTEGDSRTKFFDFMIPIIPYVNSSTSYDKLLEFFENDLNKYDGNKKNDFIDFLRDISLYIKDMRLLKNIYNEYKIYDKKIGRKLDKVKLLAVMVYKNFYPEDFSLLHKDQGIVFNVFKNRNKYVKEIDNKYIKDIELLKNKIKQIEKEQVSNIDDLRKIYVFSLIKKIGNNPSQLRADNHNILFNEAISDEKFELIKNSKNIRNPNYSYNAISFEDIENEINDLSYDEREKLIINKNNTTIQNLNQEIKDLEKKQKSLNSKTISELCLSENMDSIIGKDIIDDKGLLKFLILNGFIDENYYMYLSYSFEKSLTSSDTEYLKSVINNIGISYDFALTNLKEIVNKLRINEFKKSSVLNFNLLDYLLDNKSIYKKQYDSVMSQLIELNEKSLDFIFQYLKILPKHNVFIVEIVKKWNGFWKYIYNGSFTSEEKEDFFYQILMNIAPKNIISLNIDETLKNYIENLSKIRSLSEEENNSFKELLKLLNIKFKNLNEPIENISIFNYIYDNNHYILNKLMIEQIILTKVENKNEIINGFKTKHLTTILAFDKDRKLIQRIEDNIESYIVDVFLKIETNNNEDEETLITLLNNEDLDNDIKSRIIDSQKLIILDVSKIKHIEVLEVLIKKNKVEATWENINQIYLKFGSINSITIDYLNIVSNSEKLSKVRINNKYCEQNKNFKTKLLKNILESNEIEDSSYRLLIKSNAYWYASFDVCNIGEDKIDILLENQKLQLSKTNIEKLIECSISKYIILIENNFNDFIKDFEELSDLLSEEDYIKLLKSSKLKTEQKFYLINLLDIESFDIKEDIALLLGKLYLENKKSMSFNLLKKVISHISDDDKLKYLIYQLEINNFTAVEISNLLGTFSSPYNRLCSKVGSYEKIQNSEQNIRLLNVLKNSNCISSFSIKSKDIRVNRFKG
ncbi:hypothetical protein [Halarcobacter sp.]|uniref:YobI family P-loop NTPase n=1 Tax=Halarcobacter sp. TaxID=2321133 RepID=UPI0029F4A159|nr:hypothetical protein [Halarcobacter sp.]